MNPSNALSRVHPLLVLFLSLFCISYSSTCFHSALVSAAEAEIGPSGGQAVVEGEEDEPARSDRRVFRAANQNVHVIPNFLPLGLAEKWRDTMRQEWMVGAAANDEGAAASSDWRYTTNNKGHQTRNTISDNAKVRSLKNIDSRNSTAQSMRDAGRFAYAKWELEPTHQLVQEMAAFFASPACLKQVTDLLLDEDPHIQLAPGLSDMFVTLFSTGDFLSPHNDGASGTWAFVVSLVDGPSGGGDWKDEFGGKLRFECPLTEPTRMVVNTPLSWCENLSPRFNSLVLFKSRSSSSSGPWHEVLPVSWKAQAEGFYRFGITGWFMDRKDVMSDYDRKVRDEMRGSSKL